MKLENFSGIGTRSEISMSLESGVLTSHLLLGGNGFGRASWIFSGGALYFGTLGLWLSRGQQLRSKLKGICVEFNACLTKSSTSPANER